jgi:hypothetical protein
MSGDLQNRAAQMLLVGFCKHWLVGTAAQAVEQVDLSDDAECVKLHERAPCLPANRYEYRRPARAFVLSQWPKLGAYLLKHEKDPEKVLALIPQVEKLMWKPNVRTQLHSREDRTAAAKAQREAKVQQADYRLSRDVFKTAQRSAWNVCKG